MEPPHSYKVILGGHLMTERSFRKIQNGLNEALEHAKSDPMNDITQLSTLYSNAIARAEKAEEDRDEARQIVRDIHWMARRYADGRLTYAPGMFNDAITKAIDAGWLQNTGVERLLATDVVVH